MATNRLIGHLDADCFYVSAERVRHPQLRGMPVVVLGNQGACCIAKSYEAKAAGITTGEPIWEAVNKCPETVFIKRDFRWYEVLSRRMLDLLKEVSPLVEYYSIDEMFFDASYLPAAFDQPLPEAVQTLQQLILKRVGVPVSIGVSPSKCLSKLASDARKPFGCTLLINQDETHRFLAGLDVAELWGIGGKSQAKLIEHGITSCLDFARSDRQFILRLLTVKGEGIWWELRGESVLPIQTERPAHKRISRGGSLGGATSDPAKLRAWAIRNVERLIEELDFYHVKTRRLILSLAYKGDGGSARRVTLPIPVAEYDQLAAAALALLKEAWDGRSPVGYMHLDAEMLEPHTLRQMTFYDQPEGPSAKVARVKREVNQKLGRFTLRSAETMAIEEVYADETNDYDICDVHGKMCF